MKGLQNGINMGNHKRSKFWTLRLYCSSFLSLHQCSHIKSTVLRMSSCRQVPRHNRHNYTNLCQSCTVHVNDFKQLTTLWRCTSTLPQFHENSLKEIPSGTTKFQYRTYYNRCSQMRNNCKCLSSAQCSLIVIINVKAPPILRIQVFWDVMLCHWPSGFSHFEGSCCLQTKQKWSAMFGHRRLQKSIWLPKNDKKTIPPHSVHSNKIFLWCQWYQAVHVQL